MEGVQRMNDPGGSRGERWDSVFAELVDKLQQTYWQLMIREEKQGG